MMKKCLLLPFFADNLIYFQLNYEEREFFYFLIELGRKNLTLNSDFLLFLKM